MKLIHICLFNEARLMGMGSNNGPAASSSCLCLAVASRLLPGRTRSPSPLVTTRSYIQLAWDCRWISHGTVYDPKTRRSPFEWRPGRRLCLVVLSHSRATPARSSVRRWFQFAETLLPCESQKGRNFREIHEHRSCAWRECRWKFTHCNGYFFVRLQNASWIIK